MNATLSFFLFLAATAVSACSLFTKRTTIFCDLIARILAAIAVLLLLILLLWRSFSIGFPALTGMYEGLTFFSGAIGGLTLFMMRKGERASRMIRLWGFLVAAVLLALASSPLAPSSLSYPVPALRSGWLVLHVSFSFLGEAAFAVSFAAAITWFLAKRPETKNKAEAVASAAVALGYPVYTLGALLFGAIWAQYAWGRFWGWDPKEIWALVTWLVYTLYLHIRLGRKRRGAFPMAVLVLGFALALFTFLGVNFLASGLHSYR